MKALTSIPINIWDDYYEEGHIPEGEKQETFIYVEDDGISAEIRKEYLEKLLDYIDKNLKLEGVKSWLHFYDSKTKYPTLEDRYNFRRWEIRIENLTHKRREKLLDELKNANLSMNGVPFEIYSES